MKMNRIQFQAGMSLNQFLADYGTESQCEAILEILAGLVRFSVPQLQSTTAYVVSTWSRESLSMSRLSNPDHVDGRNNFSLDKITADPVVSSHVFSQPNEK
jgi:hypothetical protein